MMMRRQVTGTPVTVMGGAVTTAAKKMMIVTPVQTEMELELV